jgi:hypothetical protein
VSRAVLSTNDSAARVAEETLKAGGNAIDGALAGWLEVAASTTWGLLAPVTFGVSGMGAGLRFVDGLARTPGRDLVRPVRYPDAVSAPAFARLAVPTSVAALSVSVALGASFTLSKLGNGAVATAKRLGADARAKLLKRVAGAGFLALKEGSFRDELERMAPRIDGRVLTEADFEDVVPEVRGADVTTTETGGELSVPTWWAAPNEATSDVLHLLVIDRWGTLATASWSRPAQTMGLYENEVHLPLLAAPLIKGLPRTPVGQRIGAPHAVGVLTNEIGTFALAATTGQLPHVLSAAERIASTPFDTNTRSDAREEILIVGAPRGAEPYARRLAL